MIYLIANWKSHHTITQSIHWLETFNFQQPEFPSQLKTILALPFTDIPEFNRQLGKIKLPLITAAQNVSRFEEGKHTGEVTASMLSELVKFCLVGHSERRRQMGETSEHVVAKCQQLLKSSITPIICLDKPYLKEQIDLLKKAQIDLDQCIFVYESISAIGTGQPISPQDANQVAKDIQKLTQSSAPILYGGSVTQENGQEFITQSNLDGVLVGTDSLDPQDFAKIINQLPKDK